MSSSKCPFAHTNLTMGNGAPVADNQNSLTAGSRGPLLAQDLWLNEKLADFVREVIPERRMHAKGSGAFGTFTVTHDITKYTRAKIFSEVGKKTEMFARFTTVAGERGAAVSILKLATREPITAPTPKRKLPINELAVPAIVGNFSKMEAVALDDMSGFCPTKKATPIAIDQKPKSKSAVKNNQIPEINCTAIPICNMVSAPNFSTNFPFK